MQNQETLQQLNNILETVPLTVDQKEAIETCIKKLQTDNTIEVLIQVVTILASLFGGGS